MRVFLDSDVITECCAFCDQPLEPGVGDEIVLEIVERGNTHIVAKLYHARPCRSAALLVEIREKYKDVAWPERAKK